jgi:hypothetical protein
MIPRERRTGGSWMRDMKSFLRRCNHNQDRRKLDEGVGESFLR